MKRSLFKIIGQIAAVVILVPLSVGCNSSEEPENVRVDIPLSPTTKAVATELVDFYPKFTVDAIKTADALSGSSSDNVIVSPISASILLGMIANGVDGQLSSEISDYLNVSNLTGLNSLAVTLLNNLPAADSKCKFSLSNSLWYSPEYKLSDGFAHTISSDFKTSINRLSFNQGSALEKINEWISTATSGVIKDYSNIMEINPNTIAVLLNALYFKGEWKAPYFDKGNTKKESFTTFEAEKTVETMHTSGTTGYARTERFKACSLEFGNGAFSMLFVLPLESGVGKASYPVVTSSDLEEILTTLYPRYVSIALPKFRLSGATDLNSVFSTAGLSELNGNIALTMFDPAPENSISLKQGCSLTIDEKGAEVAAVSSGVIMDSAPSSADYLQFNRPFYFFLTEKSTGACLLSGRIADPN